MLEKQLLRNRRGMGLEFDMECRAMVSRPLHNRLRESDRQSGQPPLFNQTLRPQAAR
jgi:hypothetical protein